MKREKIDKCKRITGVNVDTIIDTQINYCDSCTGLPRDNSNGYLITIKYTNEYMVQKFFRRATKDEYTRYKENDVWTKWKGTEELLNISKITHIKPTHSLVSNYQPYGNSYYYKVGSRVHVHIGVKIDTTDYVHIYQLPEGYRPYMPINMLGIGASLINTTGFCINTNGEIALRTNNSYGCVDIEYDAVS